MAEVSSEPRPYGREEEGDVYESACAHECRLGCLDACRGRGACRLEVTPDRPSRALSAYFDNRRGILKTMAETGKAQTTVRTFRGDGLPQNDPITIWGQGLERGADNPDPTPYYEIRAENVPVDGPHRLTLYSLNARIEDYGQRRRPSRRKNGGKEEA